ncbi:TPA: VWA domain-containing protein [Clostridium perfringens]|uniref:VWA domain-containing protein n=1 Tax=Clostridium perfringens TaxID=1502 RepID=A0A6G4ZFT3_CLOPF|nr:VWA domain-containing protein [Clostridium perfringens]MDK0642202.1 VWA domain-containing protein [Clostridium perfringens]MDK0701294.1 VWA domain-containing protein [Clostridium perfringens]MDK0736247.1 VWA domain-containing protein [Clostridium perfringens]MDM0766573.1 VWA domain-containing protein [Clostridium perfringens]MDM0883193.1 VWA domain-containing protein [Clostridium perfringens]
MNLLKNKRRVNFAIISLLLVFSMAGMVAYGIVFNDPKFNIKINKSEDVIVSENGTGTVNINDGDSVNVSYNIEPQKLSIEEKPIDAVVIVDTSQTNGNNIPTVKAAVTKFANDFITGPNRRLGIVEYNGSASIVRELNSSKYTNVIEEYEKDANHLGTNTGDALRLAKSMLTKEKNNNKKVIIIMTNGFANAYTGRFFRSEEDYSNIKNKEDFWMSNYNNNKDIENHDINKDNIISSFGSSYYHGDIVFDNTGIQYDGVNTYLSERYFYLGDDEINNRMWFSQKDKNANFNTSLGNWNKLIMSNYYEQRYLGKIFKSMNSYIQDINNIIEDNYILSLNDYNIYILNEKIKKINRDIDKLNNLFSENIYKLKMVNTKYYYDNYYSIDKLNNKINSLENFLNYINKSEKFYINAHNVKGNNNLKNYEELIDEKFTETQYFNNILGQIYSCYMAKEVADSGITMYPMFFGGVNEIKNKDLIGLKDGQVKELELNGHKEKVQKCGDISSDSGILIKSDGEFKLGKNTNKGYSRYGTVYQLAEFGDATKNILIGNNSSESLEKKFNEALNMVESEVTVKTILDFSQIPKEISIDDVKIVGGDKVSIKDIGDGKYQLTITYKKEKNNDFDANNFDIEVTYKALNDTGNIIKQDVEAKIINSENNNEIAKFPKITFNIGQRVTTIDINDSRGKVGNTYNSSKNNINVGKSTEATEIFGQGYADIKVKGIGDKKKEYYFKYNFVDEDNNSIKSGTLPLHSDGNIINTSDVDIGKEGNLNAMFYENLISDTDKTEKTWTDRNKLFQKSKGKSEILPATISRDRNLNSIFFDSYNHMGIPLGSNYVEINKYWGYIQPEESGWYILGAYADDGVRAWITTDNKKIDFTNNEWGIDLAGYPGSDNGFDKGIVYLKSNFSPHRPTYYSSFEPVYLDKNMYYPIYVEYYNYGGSGAFELNYNYYGDTEPKDIRKTNEQINYIIKNYNNDYMLKYKLEDYNNQLGKFKENIKFMENGSGFKFYPSKNTTPGEIASATFSGEHNLMLPFSKKPYKITYEVIEKSNNNEKGVLKGEYGYFKNNEIFEATISSDENIYPGKEFTLNYNITPKEIPFNEGDKESISVNSINITGKLPDDIKLVTDDVENSEYKIYKNEDSKFTISFKKPMNFKHNGSKYVFDGRDKKISIPIKVNASYNIRPNKDGININPAENILSYKCGDSDELITQYFNGKLDIKNNPSTIESIGLLDYDNKTNKSIINETANNIAGGIPSKVAVEVDAKSPETSVILKIDKGTINDKTLKLYEVDENNNIISTKIDIGENNIKTDDDGKSIKINLNDILNKNNFVEKKYVIVSEITTPKVETKENPQSLNVTASIENNPNSTKNKEFISGEMPDVF